MAKKQNTDKSKITQKDEMVIQSNAVTFSIRSFSPVEEDLMTTVLYRLMDNLSSDPSNLYKSLESVKYRDIHVPVFVSDFPEYHMGYNKLESIINSIYDKSIYFRWNKDFRESKEAALIFSAIPQKDEVTGKKIPQGAMRLIVTKDPFADRSGFEVTLNPDILPYLLYIGKGVGFTSYPKQIKDSLKLKYSKRLYDMIMSYSAFRSVMWFNVTRFRNLLGIPKNYTDVDVARKILNPSVAEIQKVYPELDLVASVEKFCYRDDSTNDVIILSFKCEKENKNNFVMIDKCLRTILNSVVERGREKYIPAVIEHLFGKNRHDLVLERARFYDGEVAAGRMTRMELRNKMLYIIYRETGYDLRSLSHQKASAIWKEKI